MIIAIDLDGTLSNLHEAWLALYNRDYQDTLTPADIKSWDMHLWVKPECGQNIYRYLNFPSAYLAAEVQQGAQDVVNGWIDAGHEILVVSSCCKGSFDAKLEWLAKYFPRIPKNNFIATHRKDLIRADVLIDDGYHNLVNFPGRRILFEASWNRAQWVAGQSDGIDLAENWPDVATRLANPVWGIPEDIEAALTRLRPREEQST